MFFKRAQWPIKYLKMGLSRNNIKGSWKMKENIKGAKIHMKVCLICGHCYDRDDWMCPYCGEGPRVVHGFPSFAPEAAEATSGFNPKQFAHLVELENNSFWFRSRNRLLSWALGFYFPQARSFFEVGCGTGFVLSGIESAFPGLLVAGADIFVEALEFARVRTPRATLFQLDVRCLPFRDEFDVIGAFDVLEHIAEDDVVLSQMFRATKPGGGIMVTVPQHRFLWSYKDEYSCHKRRYTRKELVAKVKRAGFEIIRVTSFVSFLLPLMLLSRMKQRKPQDNWDPMAELKIGGFVNTLLEKVLDFERILIEGGFSFPAGGSLLVIARRN